jgi:hypothetical protein
MLILLLAAQIVSVYMVVSAANAGNGLAVFGFMVVLTVAAVCLNGLTVVNPNDAKVLQLFGVTGFPSNATLAGGISVSVYRGEKWLLILPLFSVLIAVAMLVLIGQLR